MAADSVLADRHCLPALDGYVAAREAVLGRTETDCSGALAAALVAVADAISDAEICGCQGLIDDLKALHQMMVQPDASCASSVNSLLAADDRIKSRVIQCHT